MNNENLENSIKNTADLVNEERNKIFEIEPNFPSAEIEEKKRIIIEKTKNKIIENLKHIQVDFDIDEKQLNDLYDQFAKDIRQNVQEINLKREVHKILEEEKQIEKYITAFLLADKKIEKFERLSPEEKKWLNTEPREIKFDEKNEKIEDNLRIKSFEKLENTMKEALTHVGNIFNKTKFPWVNFGSIPLTLEAETAKIPDDIDLAFADVDFPIIYDNFKNLEKEGIVRNIHLDQMKGFDKKFNGCTVIKAQIRTGNNPNYKWIDAEAFAQNIDPSLPVNGLCNIGLKKLNINKYALNETTINCIDSSEIKKLYLSIGAAELLKYDIDNSFLHSIKNKFPQRLNNIISMIKRKELEEFEKKLSKGEAGETDRPNTEKISNAEIMEMIDQFVSYNEIEALLPLAEISHSTGNPSEIILNRLTEFKLKAQKEKEEHKIGFTESKINDSGIYADCTCRETVLDKLTEEGSKDMNDIAKNYIELEKSQKEFNNLINTCNNDLEKCEENSLTDIAEMKNDLNSHIEEILESIRNVRDKYSNYLKEINAKDNRDFIAYVSISQILENYIVPSLDTAVVAYSEMTQKMKELNVNINNINLN